MQGAKFRYLPHTADIRFAAYGRDLKELIENSALAMLSVMLDVKKIRAKREKAKEATISEKAGTREDLVWYVLQDILTKVDERKLCAFEFKADSVLRWHTWMCVPVSFAMRIHIETASASILGSCALLKNSI